MTLKIQPDQICFGLSDELDRQSFSCFLQLAGKPEFADVLAGRLSSQEIDSYVNLLMGLLRRHLSEDEYHRLFLGDPALHQH